MIRIDEQSRKWWILAALAAAGGKLGDAIGQKVLFVVVVALFGLASLAAGFAPSGAWRIVARAIQGMGAAVIFPGSVAMITIFFPEEQRGVALRICGTIGTIFLTISAPSAAARPESLPQFGCQAGQRKEPADIGVRDVLVLREVGDRPGLTALDPPPPAVRTEVRPTIRPQSPHDPAGRSSNPVPDAIPAARPPESPARVTRLCVAMLRPAQGGLAELELYRPRVSSWTGRTRRSCGDGGSARHRRWIEQLHRWWPFQGGAARSGTR